MGNRTIFWVMFGLLLIGTMTGVGYWAYNAGLAHGLANARAAAGGAPVVVWPRWGFGFGFFPFFPIFFFILVWVFFLRGLFWRGRGWGPRLRLRIRQRRSASVRGMAPSCSRPIRAGFRNIKGLK